jgi:hypothetical protein
VYSTCLRCDRSLGTNSEIPHLSVGRRIAFDVDRGRLWVICTQCGQWNLTPLEERWEALAECEKLARSAEARSGGMVAALTQTTSGLELLRVGGMSDADIANWRYGRRIHDRRQRQLLTLMPLEGLAVGFGLAIWRATDSGTAGLYAFGWAGFALFWIWRRPPRLWRRFFDGEGRQRILWHWQLQHLRIERDSASNGLPVLVVPRMSTDMRLQGSRAATALASILPGINGGDCVGVDLRAVVGRVTGAEEEAGRPPKRPGRAARRRIRASGNTIPKPVTRRPWEHLVGRDPVLWVLGASPDERLALEMAVTEEVEQRELQARTESLAEEWRDEEEIGAISDDLLLPESVTERLRELKEE